METIAGCGSTKDWQDVFSLVTGTVGQIFDLYESAAYRTRKRRDFTTLFLSPSTAAGVVNLLELISLISCKMLKLTRNQFSL